MEGYLPNDNYMIYNKEYGLDYYDGRWGGSTQAAVSCSWGAWVSWSLSVALACEAGMKTRTRDCKCSDGSSFRWRMCGIGSGTGSCGKMKTNSKQKITSKVTTISTRHESKVFRFVRL